MTEPLIFVNTYAINPDRIGTLRRGFGKTAELVRAEEPKMLYFGCHISEDGTEATTLQVHADAGNMAFHLQLVGDHIRRAAEYLEFSSMRIHVFGTTTDELVEELRCLTGSGASVTISSARRRLPSVRRRPSDLTVPAEPRWAPATRRDVHLPEDELLSHAPRAPRHDRERALIDDDAQH